MIEALAKFAYVAGGYGLIEALVRKEKYVYSCPICDSDIEKSDMKCHVCETELDWDTNES